MSDDKQLAVQDGSALDAAMEMKPHGFVMTSVTEVHRFAQWVIKAGMAPKCYESAGQVLVAIQHGAEAGLTPMMSIRSIYVVPGSGVASWTTEAVRALVRRGFWDPFERRITRVLHPGTDLQEGVWHSHKPTGSKKDCTNDCHGWCETWPVDRNGESVRTEFTVAHAKQANLWDKSGGWQTYTDRMLMHRATAFHCRDNYGGVLLGLQAKDEVEDMPRSAVPRLSGGQIPETEGSVPVDPLFGPSEGDGEVEVVDVEPDSDRAMFEAQDVTPEDGPTNEQAGLFEPQMSDEKKAEVLARLENEDVERDPETGEVIPDEVGK